MIEKICKKIGKINTDQEKALTIKTIDSEIKRFVKSDKSAIDILFYEIEAKNEDDRIKTGCLQSVALFISFCALIAAIFNGQEQAFFGMLETIFILLSIGIVIVVIFVILFWIIAKNNQKYSLIKTVLQRHFK